MIDSLRRVLVAGLASLLPLTVLPAGASATPAPGWRIVDTVPQQGPGLSTQFYDIAAPSASDAWAVGDQYVRVGNFIADRPLIRHWNGVAWLAMQGPKLPANFTDATFYQVRATSTSNVWGFGQANYKGTPDQGAYAARWDGAHWRLHDFGSGTAIRGVAAFSPTNVWMLGETNFYSRNDRPEALHWNGTAWKSVPIPAFPEKLSARSASDMWATAHTSKRKATLLHWNGKTWREVPAPHVTLPKGALSYRFHDVLARGSKDVWVTVGFGASAGMAPGYRLFRWNGKAWRQELSLPADTPVGMLGDGGGGFWLLTAGTQPLLKHFVNGKIVGWLNPPAQAGAVMGLQSEVIIPGTRSMLVVGEDLTPDGQTTAVIAQYGP
jgi:hypothetical protein